MTQDKYSKHYSDHSFIDRLAGIARRAGISVVYAALLLYYVLQEASVPAKARATVIGALGYLIFPVDAIPDLIPVVGYSDDIGVLILALAMVSMHINDEVRQKARRKLQDWFGDIDEADLQKIEDQAASSD